MVRLIMVAFTIVLVWLVVPIAIVVGFLRDIVMYPNPRGVRRAVLTAMDRGDSLLWFTGVSVIVNWKELTEKENQTCVDF